MKAFISVIQKFSVDDGPGIRDTVFFKGCNLHCQWCHNPECISNQKSLLFDAKKCLICKCCSEVCAEGCHSFTEEGNHVFNREKCILCGACAAFCPVRALEINGKWIDQEELKKEVLKDRVFFRRSNGGVTFSGGECMLQVDFLEEALSMLQAEGIHTAVDTAGCVPWTSFERIIPHTDLFLYDMKLWSADLHRKYTGVDNTVIKDNLYKLSKSGAHIWIRIPVISEVNMGKEMKKISDFLATLPKIDRIQLLPFHKYGENKYQLLGKEYKLNDLCVPTEYQMKEELQILIQNDLNAEIA